MTVVETNCKTMTDVELIDEIEQLNMSDEWSASEWNRWNEITAERKARESSRRSSLLDRIYNGGYK